MIYLNVDDFALLKFEKANEAKSYLKMNSFLDGHGVKNVMIFILNVR